jgi:osmotically-inducible protein OsmY
MKTMKTLKLKEWAKRTAIGRWSASLLIATAMQTLVLPSLQAASAKMEITDNGITTAVEDGLARAKGLLPNDVDVSTSQGVVTLSGSVENLPDKERVIKTAKSVRGVRGVIDQLTVYALARPDDEIRADIQAALHQDPATEAFQTTAAVHDAVATLTGSVGSYAEQQLATQIASGVKGVKAVHNQISIDYLGQRTDEVIAADVKARLQWDVWVNGGLIKPVVKDGKVTLTGTIGSAISKSRVFDDAWVNGVTSVDDSGLKIEPWTHNGANQKFKNTSNSDGEIQKAVQSALRADPRVSAFSPDVTVADGVVTLRGTVGNLKAETSAQQDAKNIVGVQQVENHLKVRNKAAIVAADTEKQLKTALSWDPWLDSSTIDVAVINHVAYLSGGVESSFQKAEAQDVASRTAGVLEIRNHLKVQPDYSISMDDYYSDYDYGYYYGDYGFYGWPYGYYNQSPYYVSELSGPQPYKSDAQIKKSIEDRLFWSPFVDRDDVKVTVVGAVVTLTGTVNTWIGYGEADKDARKGGATSVLNRITVNKGHWW